MTEEQIRKARIALLKHDNIERLKLLKLTEHEECAALVSVVRLPYRVIKANICTWQIGDGGYLLPVGCPEVVPISRFYPNRQPTTEEFREWLKITYPDTYASVCSTPAAWLGWAYSADKATKKDSDGKPIVDFATCQSDAYTALEQEFHISRRGFKDDNERRYLFGHFLAGYDLDGFSVFDLYGSKDHGAEEVERFRDELKALQADYNEHPNNYYNPIQTADKQPMQDDLIATCKASADGLSGIDAASTADDLIGMGEVSGEGEL